MKSADKQSAKSKGGREKQDSGRKIVDIAVQAALKGITPVEVMLDNMRFAHDKANDLFGKLIEVAKTMDPGTKPDGEPITNPADLIDMFREAVRFRNMAQSCAQDVAPYIHPKYTTITLNTEDDSPFAIHIRRTIVDPERVRAPVGHTNTKKAPSVN